MDPSAAVLPMAYRSSLSDHRAYQASEVGSWSQANETVNRIGGWRRYAREADGAPTPAAPAAPGAPGAAAKPAAPTGHRHP